MAFKKATLVFAGRQCGWTESYYQNTNESHETVIHKAFDLARDRIKLLGKECSIKAIRVATEGAPNDGVLRYANDLNGMSQEPADEQDVALMVRCENAEHTKWKLIYLRGIWDRVATNHGQYVGRAIEAWKGHITDFFGRLVNDAWGWVGSTPANLGLVKTLTISQEDCLQYTLHANAFTVDEVTARKKLKIRVSGVNGKSTANGSHVVRVIAQDKVETITPLAVAKYRFGGVVKGYTYDFIDIAQAFDQKIVTRECGAPLLESRGRARAKPRA